MSFHLDFESYSECDISLGAYRYAADPSTRVLMYAICKDDGPVYVWDSKNPDSDDSQEAELLFMDMEHSPDSLIFSHNAPFEIAITKYVMKADIDINRWRCTAAMCRRAAIPFSLAGASEFLRLPQEKDKAGKRLIQLFSVPQKKPLGETVTIEGKKYTVDQAWQMFVSYCRRDVEVERELHRRLKGFELKGFALESFLFDLRMNDLGVPVNLPALEHTMKMVCEYNATLGQRYHEITGLDPSQNTASLEWFQARGYTADNLQADTVETHLEKDVFEDGAREALEIRKLLSFAAVKKIPTMIEAACPDSRVRGAFMWSGAIRTHRWAGRVIQPQNMKRPTIKDIALAFDMIEAGHDLETFTCMWESPLEVFASCIRNFISEPDHHILDADFANIEARITPWLCDDPMLDEFRRGEDVYITMAASIFGVEPEAVTKEQRFVGKQATLAAQFSVGWRKFQLMCAQYGRNLDDDVCKLAIFKYRKKRTKIVEAWRLFQDAAVAAIQNPGERFPAGRVSFIYGNFGGFAALAMRLPSGHNLMYPDPRLAAKTIEAEVIKENEDGELYTEKVSFETLEIRFYGQLPMSSQWGTVSTYGGKLLENATQAVGGDFMSHGLLCAEKAGFKVFATIHDQALAVFEPDKLQTAQAFRQALCTLPEWAKDFPLEASVDITKYYTKLD